MRRPSQLRLNLAAILLAASLWPAHSRAQTSTGAPPASGDHRQRLILKDGSYQIIDRYQIKGDLVVYRSAERNATEEIPLALIDWAATRKWDLEHSPEGRAQLQAEEDARDRGQQQRAVLNPELAREEADRANRTPEVAPNLHLPETGSAFALDVFRGEPELVPLPQQNGDLNPLSSHSTVKLALNPMASPHAVITLKGEGSNYQMHVAKPVFYLRIGDAAPAGPATFTVDTHGASAGKDDPSGGSEQSRYVIVRADIRVAGRALNSFSIASLGAKHQEDVIETEMTLLPGGYWMAITPKEPLEFGEYALVEVLDNHTLNAAPWDFGVHSQRGDNRDSLKPEARRPPSLGRRPNEQ